MARKKSAIKNSIVEFKLRLVKPEVLKDGENPIFPSRETRTYTCVVDVGISSSGIQKGDKILLEEIFSFEDGDFIAVVVDHNDVSSQIHFGNAFSLSQSILLINGDKSKAFVRKNIDLIGKVTVLK